MKNQGSLNLKITDTPVSDKALDGCLMLRATSSGLQIHDSTGAVISLGGGTSAIPVRVVSVDTTTLTAVVQPQKVESGAWVDDTSQSTTSVLYQVQPTENDKGIVIAGFLILAQDTTEAVSYLNESINLLNGDGAK